MADYISKPDLMGKLTSSEMQQKIKGMTGIEAYTTFLLMVCNMEKADIHQIPGSCDECKYFATFDHFYGICERHKERPFADGSYIF